MATSLGSGFHLAANPGKRHPGRAMFVGALSLGVEGIVAKDAAEPYVEGPLKTWHWQKIKNKDYKRKEKVEFSQSTTRAPTARSKTGVPND